MRQVPKQFSIPVALDGLIFELQWLGPGTNTCLICCFVGGGGIVIVTVPDCLGRAGFEAPGPETR